MAKHRFELPPALAAALAGRRLAIFAGAGISIWTPSSLPGWAAFNEIVLDEVRTLAIRAAPETLVGEMRGLTLDDIGSKDFSDALVNDLLGSAYFDILRSLDARRPNPCHRAIATLGLRRRLRAVVTTNFDTLIEQAFQAAHCPLTVLARPADYLGERRTTCSLLKIHGSARRGDELVDTVRQKMRGLHQVVRARINDVFANHHVLVLGFSGEDLSFGADYLALKGIGASSPGITWVVRPDSEVPSLVRKLVARAGSPGTPLAADLGDVLSRITGRPLQLSLDEAARRSGETEIRTVARRVLRREQPLNALAFWMRLLARTGRIEAASAVWRFLAKTIRVCKPAESRDLGASLRAMAAEAPLLAGPRDQAEWANAELQRVAVGAGPDAAQSDNWMTDMDRRAAAIAFSQMAEALTQVGDDRAGTAMEQAMNHTEWLCDIALLSQIYSTYGWRAAFRRSRRPEDDEQALAWLFAAEAAALIGGDIEAANAALRRSEILIRVGEYDTALDCIHRLERRFDLGVRQEMHWVAETQKGQIDLRRGRLQAAVTRWQKCAERHAANRIAAASVHAVMISHLGFSPEWRPLVLRLATQMIAAMDAGALPSDGRLRELSARSYYERAVRVLGSNSEAAFPPFFVRYEEPPRDALEEIRRDLIASEYRCDVPAILRGFERLVGEHYSQGRVERMLECALAQRARARRDGTADARFRASANVAAARYWTGDRPAAGPLYARLYRDEAARRRRYSNGLGRRLPSAFWSAMSPRGGVVPDISMPSRRFTLDGFAALRNRRGQPATLRQLGDLAKDAIDAREFGMGRIYVFELVAGCKAIGDRAGEAGGYNKLAEAADVEHRYGQAAALRAKAAQCVATSLPAHGSPGSVFSGFR